VEADGSIAQVDSLSVTYSGAAATGLSVFDDAPFDAALRHPGIVARQVGSAALSKTCLQCPVHRVCGGGLYPHRYRAGSGFLNPSIYCPDLKQLVDYVRERIAGDQPRSPAFGYRTNEGNPS